MGCFFTPDSRGWSSSTSLKYGVFLLIRLVTVSSALNMDHILVRRNGNDIFCLPHEDSTGVDGALTRKQLGYPPWILGQPVMILNLTKLAERNTLPLVCRKWLFSIRKGYPDCSNMKTDSSWYNSGTGRRTVYRSKKAKGYLSSSLLGPTLLSWL